MGHPPLVLPPRAKKKNSSSEGCTYGTLNFVYLVENVNGSFLGLKENHVATYSLSLLAHSVSWSEKKVFEIFGPGDTSRRSTNNEKATLQLNYIPCLISCTFTIRIVISLFNCLLFAWPPSTCSGSAEEALPRYRDFSGQHPQPPEYHPRNHPHPPYHSRALRDPLWRSDGCIAYQRGGSRLLRKALDDMKNRPRLRSTNSTN